MRKMVYLSLLGWFVLSWGGQAYAKPAVEIVNPFFDFGKVCQHAVVAHTFWIKSTGDDTLKILKVVPGCGCTKAPLEDSVIAPGDSTSIEIFFSTRSFRGIVSKRPYIETNAGEEKVYLKIRAELLPEPDTAKPLTLSPYDLDVSQFTSKPRRKAKFLIQNKSERDYKLTLIDWPKKYFDVELPKKVKAGETVEGMVIVHKDAVDKEFKQSLTFELDDENHTRYTLPVSRVVRIKDKK